MSELTKHLVKGNPSDELKVRRYNKEDSGAYSSYEIDTGSNDRTGSAICVRLDFQKGPVGESGVNGLTNEVLLAVVLDRLSGFQTGPFPCNDNKDAITAISDGLEILKGRTRERMARGVEGLNKA